MFLNIFNFILKHVKFHNDKIANKYSFYDILTLNETDVILIKEMNHLRARCLEPGLYFKHILNWLHYFGTNQLIHVDGELLRIKPFQCLNDLQKRIPQIDVFVDYKFLLKFNKKKGFFCPFDRQKNVTKCLGSSKGRKYDKIDPVSEIFLKNFYKEPNKKFFNFLIKHSYSMPLWYKDFV